jgi:formylglycine-generating enzyme required for sulfatase activity
VKSARSINRNIPQTKMKNIFNFKVALVTTSINNILRLATLAAACLALPTHALAQIIPCPEDVNGDGVVDSSDLGLVLLAIGDCPVSEPTISAVNPNTGTTTGGTAITITGTNLTGASSVRVGSGYATSVVVVNDTTVTAVTPAGTAGAMDVSLITAGGIATLTDGFTYGAWYTILEQVPNATVVPDATVRANIVASGFPWRVRDNSSGIEMLLIPGGTFNMGCSASNSYGCNSDETNHQVTLSKAFYLGKTEVTQAQWEAKMRNNPSAFSGNANNPVETVSWNDIVGFNTATGLRLPSEAEWEYAYRGGTTTAFHSMPGYPNGTNDDNQLGDIAWYGSNDSPFGTKPVAGKAANAFGMYDMSGNVYEWCNDWYGSTYYTTSPSTDPAGPSSGSDRVLRGGYWDYYSDHCRSSDRLHIFPGSRYRGVGFRVARTP